MKILMVAIPNHHFFQWVNQLEDSGFEVFWFDVTDGGPKSNKIPWVTQIKGWKLKYNFIFRQRIKKQFPKLYNYIQKYNENNVLSAFEKAYNNIQPDIVHAFEMQLSGLPVLPIMQKNKTPLIYSSWGSDLFYFKELGLTKTQVNTFFKRTNYLITDCKRDFKIAKNNGFKAKYLGVFPGNGGLKIDMSKIKKFNQRHTILIKGYDDGVGKASIVLKALELVSKEILKKKTIVIYSADDSIKKLIEASKVLSSLNIIVHSRYKFIKNRDLLALMGESCIHIANSLSDGMPNALLEAMAMGAFPIQSNPGKVTEEVITANKNGLLIENPLDANALVMLIEKAIEDVTLRQEAQDFNVNFIKAHYNRSTLKPEIIKLYQNIKHTSV
ncbi:glycosyl transferase family 1 [Flavivirga aquatica]|uniref:Glycosyl transferase family 1 n=1 Tax=Flavivirga aquatica TaxID=1849968 RepID=A0A1E5TBX6_9FLAO|nr:glycosyltransferase [Flavivirga aquatica]OEK08849.1 glycosyl transferase family 1 [Flavivirga aquatica]